MIRRFVRHNEPLWSNRVDFFIHADLDADGMVNCSEQLAVRSVGHHRFEICCLPFYCYGLSVGDIVQAVESADGRLVSGPLTQDGGNGLVRAAFQSRVDAEALHTAVHDALTLAGLAHEWNGVGYVAVLCEPLAADTTIRFFDRWDEAIVAENAKGRSGSP
jgi:Domain of unknown function (DUF4265)